MLDNNPKRSRKAAREKLIIVRSSRTRCQHFRESVLRATVTALSARTASPHVTFRSYFEVFTEHFLLVFMSIIDFRFVQFKYHISIGIGWKEEKKRNVKDGLGRRSGAGRLQFGISLTKNVLNQ